MKSVNDQQLIVSKNDSWFRHSVEELQYKLNRDLPPGSFFTRTAVADALWKTFTARIIAATDCDGIEDNGRFLEELGAPEEEL